MYIYVYIYTYIYIYVYIYIIETYIQITVADAYACNLSLNSYPEVKGLRPVLCCSANSACLLTLLNSGTYLISDNLLY